MGINYGSRFFVTSIDGMKSYLYPSREIIAQTCGKAFVKFGIWFNKEWCGTLGMVRV